MFSPRAASLLNRAGAERVLHHRVVQLTRAAFASVALVARIHPVPMQDAAAGRAFRRRRQRVAKERGALHLARELPPWLCGNAAHLWRFREQEGELAATRQDLIYLLCGLPLVEVRDHRPVERNHPRPASTRYYVAAAPHGNASVPPR